MVRTCKQTTQMIPLKSLWTNSRNVLSGEISPCGCGKTRNPLVCTRVIWSAAEVCVCPALFVWRLDPSNSRPLGRHWVRIRSEASGRSTGHPLSGVTTVTCVSSRKREDHLSRVCSETDRSSSGLFTIYIGGLRQLPLSYAVPHVWNMLPAKSYPDFLVFGLCVFWQAKHCFKLPGNTSEHLHNDCNVNAQ